MSEQATLALPPGGCPIHGTAPVVGCRMCGRTTLADEVVAR